MPVAAGNFTLSENRSQFCHTSRPSDPLLSCLREGRKTTGSARQKMPVPATVGGRKGQQNIAVIPKAIRAFKPAELTTQCPGANLPVCPGEERETHSTPSLLSAQPWGAEQPHSPRRSSGAAGPGPVPIPAPPVALLKDSGLQGTATAQISIALIQHKL